MVVRLRRAELHRLAKFDGNRSNRYRDMTIFRFFQDGGHPPSWICFVCSNHPQRAFGGLYRCAKFGWNRCSSFDNMHVFYFTYLAWKRLFTPQNWGFWGIWPPKWGALSTRPQKAHPWAERRHMTYRSWKSVHCDDLCAWRSDQKRKTKTET